MPELVMISVFDWVYGCPAAGVSARLHRFGDPRHVTAAETDKNGVCRLAVASDDSVSSYRVALDIDPYFTALGIRAACAEVAVAFRGNANVVVHIAPFGHAVYVTQPQTSAP